MLLEPYCEQRFSNLSHGLRPNRGCHSALREIPYKWTGTVWPIEGDIKGCFDNIGHQTLLEIIRRDIHDGRLEKLLKDLLAAGYLEDRRYHDTLSGTPQGGIISPLLANIYLNELDKYVEDTLIRAYTTGERRRANPAYTRIHGLIREAEQRAAFHEVKCLKQSRRPLMSADPVDANYRRLRHVRCADDFLLGFVGPKKEAEEIRQRLGEFLGRRLGLTLSKEKTLITHAGDGKATFLGYEIKVTGDGNHIAENEKRATNGKIALLMPQKVILEYRDRYSKGGEDRPRHELIADTDYTVIQRYQSVPGAFATTTAWR